MNNQLKQELINEFNELGIEDMEQVTDLNELTGEFVNLEYEFPSGEIVKIWENDKIYFGNQLCKIGDEERCYGLVADEKHLFVCEYGEDGVDAEVVVYKRRG